MASVWTQEPGTKTQSWHEAASPLDPIAASDSLAHGQESSSPASWDQGPGEGGLDWVSGYCDRPGRLFFQPQGIVTHTQTHTHTRAPPFRSLHSDPFILRARPTEDKLPGEARGLEGHCRRVTHLSSLPIYCATPDPRSMR